MPHIRILFLWHMHQPFYKDLAQGKYRLPWVRMHGLKDYYGMVKLLEEFPGIHQNFNLVPSLITQIQDYASGAATDPFLDVAAKAAEDLTPEERRFALQYLFQANYNNLVSRYPRFLELHQVFSAYAMDADRAEKQFSTQDYRDLQVLSQLAWFDEFFLEQPDVQQLVAKARDYSLEDQRFIVARQQEIMAAILPAYKAAAARGAIEISTSPFYHPILPLICDTDQGRVSHPGLPLPQARFRHPEDATEQITRGLTLHEQTFGLRPHGMWPSEGSVSEEVIALSAQQGMDWMATDEGVLGRTIGGFFERSHEGVLTASSAEALYNIYRYENGDARMHMVFRDHSLSDLIGFVYSGMPPEDAAAHFIATIKQAAQPMLEAGKDAVVPVILDGENAWEYFPRSGREFLRRLYSAIQQDGEFQSLTISEATAQHREQDFGRLGHLVPGSWINSNFNVWIGAPEDNRAWDHLYAARQAFTENQGKVTAEQRALAYEELLIAEGSDWNWWYGPEHSSANDRDFDELYRSHLSNVYQALGLSPPEHLAQPIMRSGQQARFVDQSAYIRPRIDGADMGYFDWLGAAHYIADRRAGAMHGKTFLMDSAYVGMDERHLYCRLDFAGSALGSDGGEQLAGDFDIAVIIQRQSPESDAEGPTSPAGSYRIHVAIRDGALDSSSVQPDALERSSSNGQGAGELSSAQHPARLLARVGSVLETQLSLDYLEARPNDRLLVRFSAWQNGLPLDSLPAEGFITIRILNEGDLLSAASADHWSV